MPYSNATRREMSRRRRNEMTAEEIQNARQQAHDRYVRRRDQETPEQREERNRRRREEYHQRRSRVGRGRGQSCSINQIMRNIDAVETLNEAQIQGVQPTPSNIHDALEYPTPNIIRSPTNNINDGTNAGGARNQEIEPLQIHLAPVTIPNESAQDSNQCAMDCNQEEQMQRRRQEALLKRPWVADASNEAGPSKRTCEIREMHEENVNNNTHTDSFGEFIDSVRRDAISLHRHPRVLLRSDPNNVVQRSTSVEAIPNQPVLNHGLRMDINHHESHRDNAQNNASNFSVRSDDIAINAHRAFRSRIDNLSIVQMCHVCNECYVGIKVFQTQDGPKCARCKSERGAHRFSMWNNMDPKEQPHVLAVLTQVEEMLISRISPILQVSHAPGGQRGDGGKNYDCFVKQSRVMNALSFKVRFDKYYAGVVIDEDEVRFLPERATDISDQLSTVVLEINDPVRPLDENVNISRDQHIDSIHHPTSFASRRPNTLREMEQIWVWLETSEDEPSDLVEWPDLGASPINEYNTEGLFDMAFPTLFPTGEGKWLQPRSMKIRLHEYAEHLMKYRDHRFATHPRFRYFIMNMIMRHRSQATGAVFVKKNAEESLPLIIHELRTQLETLLDARLAKKVMKFATTLRGTCAYWSKCLRELSDMIHQIGCPTIFFTLSAADIQWPDLHQLMPGTAPRDPVAARKWRCDNVIQHPHIIAKYMHLRYTIFREEVLTKFHGAIEFWRRYEWKHRGSPHIHEFLWLCNAPDMDRLDWEDATQVQHTKSFFDRIVHAWNPRDVHQRNIQLQRNALDDPCLLRINQIFETDVQRDYENLVNRVERHTLCSEGYCLRKKGSVMVCRYNAPWELRNESIRAFVVLNVGRKVFQKIQRHHGFIVPDNSFIHAYMDCPPQMEHLPLIEVARSWTYSECRKNEPWKPREKVAIVRVWPRFHVAPSDDFEQFEEFCWSELVLYKPFRTFDVDIGIVKEVIIERWRSFRYHAWHIKCAEEEETLVDDDDEEIEFHRSETNRDQDEWEIISGLMNAGNFPFTDVDMLGQRDFDINHDWHADYDDPDTSRCAIQFLLESRRDNAIRNAFSSSGTYENCRIQHFIHDDTLSTLNSYKRHEAFARNSRLLEAFPHCSHLPFGGRSMILLGDLAQLPPVMEKPLYTATNVAKILWLQFDHVVTLEIVLEVTLHNWELLMTRTDTSMGPDEASRFNDAIHLFSLMNGALGHVRNIVYNPSVQPPSPPTYVLVEFDNYIGNAWDLGRPRVVPITPIIRGHMRQIPLRLAWGLTIHKSQGLTLDRATVDIGNVERQGLTFTAISRVRDLNSLRITPPFSFERYARMGDSPQVNIRKKEEQRLRSLSS
eukprot:Gb_33711 [translate_table: standard]